MKKLTTKWLAMLDSVVDGNDDAPNREVPTTREVEVSETRNLEKADVSKQPTSGKQIDASEPTLRYTAPAIGTLEYRGWQNFYRLVKDLGSVHISRIQD